MPPATVSSRVATWWRQLRRHPTAWLALVLGATGAIGLGGGLAWGSWSRACAGANCPSIGALDAYRPTEALKIYGADGRLLTSLGLEQRTVVRLEELPAALPAAFIAVEDRRFFEHDGIDYRRIAGAAWRNVLERRFAEGFSTLTMQLARNVFSEKLPSTKSIARKVREVRVALELERTYPKTKLLELYLNQIFLGGSSYGVEAAAQSYFGKPAAALNVAEAALLAGIARFPNYYDPRRHPDRALRRRNLVLNLMRGAEFLTAEDAERSKAYPLALSSSLPPGHDVGSWQAYRALGNPATGSPGGCGRWTARCAGPGLADAGRPLCSSRRCVPSRQELSTNKVTQRSEYPAPSARRRRGAKPSSVIVVARAPAA